MLSIDCNEIFKQYYQNEYDFNTSSLSEDEIDEIKKLVEEKRVNYALAPIGTDIFNWIFNQNNNIKFEMVEFDSEKIDGMLYIPTTGKEDAYIILNTNKPLINQIFTATHEYYHYIKDYQKFKESPYICDFSMLKDVKEMRASRFAAELLLPERALEKEVKNYLKEMEIPSIKKMDFNDYATLIIYLTVKYKMPLKAVIYRLVEEKYIIDVSKYIENYEFMKKILCEIKIFKAQVDELYGKENKYVIPYSSVYADMEKAFLMGNASKQDILEDAKKLDLDMDLIMDFIDEEDEIEEDDDDDELFAMINENWR